MTGRIAPEDTLVLVTGGTRGIGRILAAAFAGAGYAVALTGREGPRADAAAAELVAAGGRAHGIVLDATAVSSIEGLPERLRGLEALTGTKLGVIVNNAGVVGETEGPVWENTAAELEAVIRTNVLGPFHIARVLVPLLLEHSDVDGTARTIIDLNSGSGAQGTPAYAAYSASKAALFRLADSLHAYGRARGLRVFELSPGVIRSDMTAGMPMHAHRGAEDWTAPEDLSELALALAAGRLDSYAGRYVRAGADSVEDLRAAADGLGEEDRRLLLSAWPRPR